MVNHKIHPLIFALLTGKGELVYTSFFTKLNTKHGVLVTPFQPNLFMD